MKISKSFKIINVYIVFTFIINDRKITIMRVNAIYHNYNKLYLKGELY